MVVDTDFWLSMERNVTQCNSLWPTTSETSLDMCVVVVASSHYQSVGSGLKEFNGVGDIPEESKFDGRMF